MLLSLAGDAEDAKAMTLVASVFQECRKVFAGLSDLTDTFGLPSLFVHGFS